MKPGTPALAMLFGLSASAAWADTTQEASSATREPAASVTSDGADGGQAGWTFVNGQSAQADPPNKWSIEDDRSVDPRDMGVPEPSAANKPDDSPSDHAAAAQEGDADQSATLQAPNEDEDSEQSAESPGTGGDGMMAALPDRNAQVEDPRAMPSLPRAFKDFMQSVQDKMVVILPQGWTGSVEDLLEVLKQTTDQEIVVLSQRNTDGENAPGRPSSDDESDNDEDDDDH